MSDGESGSEQERQQAEALARALERGARTDELPDDALEAAALLRYSREGGSLAEERREAILEQVLGEAKAPRSGRQRTLGWLKWLVPAGGVAAVAAVVMMAVATSRRASGPPSADAPLPPPDAALLRAQADAAGGPPAAAGELDEHMNDYRGALYASLQEHYGR